MSAATAFLTYLWHYLVARVIYDQVIRPLVHGHPGGAVALVCVAVVAFALGRLTRRRA
jgi:hypothetical protein